MKWIVLLSLLLSNAIASNTEHDYYYDFLQPLTIITPEQNQSSFNRPKALLEFQALAKIAPKSKKFSYLNYKLMQDFQQQHFNMTIKDKKIYNREKNHFVKILESIEEPSFFTLYSKLYIETLATKSLKHNDIVKLYSLANKNQQPYVQLLSYLNSLNQLNSISLTDQQNLHKQLTLLLINLPKQQQEYILRLTALQLSSFYDKHSIEFDFNRLFAQNNEIKREQVLKVLNFKDAKVFYKYIIKEKRSFFEERVFNRTMKALKRNDVAMILATLYMQNNDFSEALSYIRQAPRNNLYNPYNPFNSCIDINNSKRFTSSSHTRKFAETMSRLEERTINAKSPKARDYYLYGNGLYNKSWFGNFPMSSVFFRNKDIYKNSIPPTSNLEKALNAYERALRITPNEEFKAEIAYQILKIKFNMARIDTKNYPKGLNKMPQLDEKKTLTYLLNASKSFKEAIEDYKSDYADSKYGARVIQKSVLFTYL